MNVSIKPLDNPMYVRELNKADAIKGNGNGLVDTEPELIEAANLIKTKKGDTESPINDVKAAISFFVSANIKVDGAESIDVNGVDSSANTPGTLKPPTVSWQDKGKTLEVALEGGKVIIRGTLNDAQEVSIPFVPFKDCGGKTLSFDIELKSGRTLWGNKLFIPLNLGDVTINDPGQDQEQEKKGNIYENLTTAEGKVTITYALNKDITNLSVLKIKTGAMEGSEVVFSNFRVE